MTESGKSPTPEPQAAAGEAYRLLFEHSPEMVCMLDLEGRFTSINPAGERMTGYPAADLVGRLAVDLVAPAFRERAVRQFQERLGGDAAPDETVIVTRDGRELPVLATSTLVLHDDRPTGVLGLITDLTERRGAEEALEHSEGRFRALLESAPDSIVIADADGRIELVNARTEDLFGYHREELIGQSVDLLLSERAGSDHPEGEAGEGTDPEPVGRRKDGTVFPIEVSNRPLETATGTVVTAVIRDVSARVEAEMHLRDAKARLRSFFESAPIGEAIVAPDGRFLEVNDSLAEIVGYSPEELTALTFQDITHPDDLETDLEFVRQMLAGEIRTYQMEKRYLHKRGHLVWILLTVSLVRTSAGAPSYFISQVQGIAERKTAEEQLRQAADRYRTLIEHLPLCTYVRPVDMSLPNIYVSPQVEPMLGYPAEEWLSNPDLLASIVHPDDREYVLAAAAFVRETGKPFRGEYRYIARDGSTVWVQDETFRLLDDHGGRNVQGFLLDITERKNAEAERDRLREALHQAQKLEAMGRLAGGVAHDFNNMLTAIKGYSELLLDGLQPGTRLHHEAEQIRRAAEQASSLPEQLLAFARQQTLEVELADLNALVSAASELLRLLCGREIDLILSLSPQPTFARVDCDRIQQMLVNLALNARDAMPKGGSLTITTSTAEITGETVEDGDVAAGSYVVISVTDDGHGMDVETRERAFEPFFTTKPQGAGSGLGLASVHGTVSQSGGFVRVESEPGRGTTFRLYFPAATAVPVDPAGTSDERSRKDVPVVLLAEDEDLVRELVSSVLEREGFQVHAARNGHEALEQLDEIGRPLDLLVTDMVMPTMTGRELAERVAEQEPQAKIVFISGYSEESPTLEHPALHGSEFVRKPFSPRAFVETVNRVVTRPQRSSAPVRTAVDAAPVTCVIADDHPAVLDSVSRYLEMAGIGVVARASRADEALRAIEANRPMTALVDITMEPFDGIEIARRSAASSPETGVILYTGHHDHALLRKALEAGARGFVLKDTPLSELVTALNTVGAGGTHVDADLAEALTSAAATTPLRALTKRERQILTLLSGGMTNERVASELGISAETVQSHVRNAMTKLEADTRTQAVATAIRQALIV